MMHQTPSRHDVRMRGFQHRADVATAVRLLETRLHPLGTETVDLHHAAGRVLRAQGVAVLASLGATPVLVTRKPSVAILVTGDELLPCGARPTGFQIVDSNSVMLDALVQRDGGIASPALLLRDEFETIRD